MHSISYWIAELSPFWLSVIGLVLAICFRNVRRLGGGLAQIALFASPILIWMFQYGLTRAWGYKAIGGHVAPSWMQYAALALFIAWPALSIASIVLGKETRVPRVILLAFNIPAWLLCSADSWIILGGVTML